MTTPARVRCTDLQRQLDETRRQQERLLNLHLSGGIDETAFSTKNVELRDRISTLTFEVQSSDRRKDEKADLALRIFELSQSFPQKWIKADYAEKRRYLQMVCLNLVLKGASLCISTRKPFNALVEGLSVSDSGEGEKAE